MNLKLLQLAEIKRRRRARAERRARPGVVIGQPPTVEVSKIEVFDFAPLPSLPPVSWRR